MTTIRSELPIELGLDEAWALLTDFRGWSSWNPFVVGVSGAPRPSPGARVHLDIRWADGSGTRAVDEITEVVERGTRRSFRWSYRGGLQRAGLLRVERVLVLEQTGAGRCRYLSEERFHGPLARAVPLAKIRESSDRMAAAFAGACARQAEHSEPVGEAPSGCPFSGASTSSGPRFDAEPPMVSGALPLLGHMAEFRSQHRALFERGQREHGPVFAVALGPWRCAVVSGPEANAVFYGRTDHELLTEGPYAYLRKMFGRVGLTQTPKDYAAERHILRAPFKARLMEGNLGVIDEVVLRFIDGLGDAGDFDLVPTVEGLLQEISARVLMGEDFHARMDAEFWALYGDLAAGLDQALPPWLPLPRFIRRDIARARLHRKLGALIEERRELSRQGRQPDDLLQALVDARLEDGSVLPVERVVDYVLALVFAGFETTTGHAAWGVILLLQHRAHLERIRGQVDVALEGVERVDRKVLATLAPVRDALRETERIMPVADRHVRQADAPVEIGGYTIPAGWLLMSGVALTHRMPELYAEPEVYDPQRFERGEGKGKFTLVGFGGGSHRCTGVTLAYNEMTILLARLVQHLELELVAPKVPEIADTMGVLGPEPTRIRYRRRASSGFGEGGRL